MEIFFFVCPHNMLFNFCFQVVGILRRSVCLLKVEVADVPLLGVQASVMAEGSQIRDTKQVFT